MNYKGLLHTKLAALAPGAWVADTAELAPVEGAQTGAVDPTLRTVHVVGPTHHVLPRTPVLRVHLLAHLTDVQVVQLVERMGVSLV